MPHPLQTPLDAFGVCVREIQHMANFVPAHRDEWGPGLAIGVAGPTAGVGATTLATAVAATLSEDLDAGVALVDADFETDVARDDPLLPDRPGLSDFLLGAAAFEDVCHEVGSSGLTVVPAGQQRGHPMRIARSGLAPEFARIVRERHRYVIFDLPAISPSTTAPVLASLCDGLVIITRVGETTTVELQRTIQKLKGAHIYGVVLNRWQSRIPHWLESALALGR